MLICFDSQVDSGSGLATLPHLATAGMILVGGRLADRLLEKEVLTVTTARKLFNCGGFGGEAVLLLVVALTRDRTVAVVALTAAAASSGLADSGYSVNHLDIAPRYAAILVGIANGMGNIAGQWFTIMAALLLQISRSDDP